jgi:hypothetical protein
MLRSLQAEADDCNCERHSAGQCRLPEPLTTDLLSGDAPCQAWTAGRADRHTTNPRKHKSYTVLFGRTGSVCSLCEITLPHRLHVEEVEGFMLPYSSVDGTTGVQELREWALALKRPDGSNHFAGWGCRSQNASTWANHKRYRLPHAAPSP